MTTFDVHVWMEHDKTHHRAQLPDIPFWRASGWNPCDGPPPELDITKDHNEPAPEAPARAATSRKSETVKE